MELKMTTEARIHDGTTENPMLYNINIKGTGNLLEIEYLNSLLTKQVKVEPEVMLKLADILQILDDEEYTISVHSNDTIDDKISESIANTAIIDFKKQLKQELLSKFSA